MISLHGDVPMVGNQDLICFSSESLDIAAHLAIDVFYDGFLPYLSLSFGYSYGCFIC